MFPMTVTVHNRAELHAVMAAIGDVNEYAQAKAAAQSATPQEQSAPAATTAESPSEQAIPVGDVNAAIIALAKSKGRDAAVAVLQQFGVAKVPELKPEQYAAVMAAAKEATA
jgi:hypothetical protein